MARSLHGGTGNRWTTERLQEFIGMWLRDEPTEVMAAHFTLTMNGLQKIALRLRKNGIPLPPRKRGHKAGRKNKPWTQEEVETVIRMRNERCSTQEIACTLERSFYGVQGMILKLREEEVPVVSLGSGRRRLWDADRLRESVAGRGLIPSHAEIPPLRLERAG